MPILCGSKKFCIVNTKISKRLSKKMYNKKTYASHCHMQSEPTNFSLLSVSSVLL